MNIGDKVLVLDDTIEGVIVDIHKLDVFIETQDGFNLKYEKNELVVVQPGISKEAFIPTDLENIKKEKATKKPKNSKRIKPKERTQPAMEVDLHIHQLVKQDHLLQPHDKLEIQIDTARRQLEFAINKNIQRVVFIHGIGAGVLRTELEYLFSRYDNVSYEDANFKKYGRGATEVYIYQNPK